MVGVWHFVVPKITKPNPPHIYNQKIMFFTGLNSKFNCVSNLLLRDKGYKKKTKHKKVDA
jgi:hypothetical protein